MMTFSAFPFLFGGTFIEGALLTLQGGIILRFPFLFGGTFIEGARSRGREARSENFPSFSEGLSLRAGLPSWKIGPWCRDFPSFSEGLSLRAVCPCHLTCVCWISLPFRRDFH